MEGGLNTYGYVEGNPLNHTDRSGLQLDTLTNACSKNPQACVEAGIISSGVVLAGPKSCTVKNEEDDGLDQECEDLLKSDTATCNAITRRRGPQAGARCHASATERYAACYTGRSLPPLDTWDN